MHRQASPLLTLHGNPHIDWEALSNAPDMSSMSVLPLDGKENHCRLFHIQEISEETASAYRLAMANVLSSLCGENCTVVYALVGHAEGISLYVGISSTDKGSAISAADMLKAAFTGNFLGAKLHRLFNDDIKKIGIKHKRIGLITGVPTLNNKDDQVDNEEFQGVERLVNSLSGKNWQLTIVAEPASDRDIREALEQIYDLSTSLSENIRHSVQHSKNDSETHGSSGSLAEGESNGRTTGTNRSDSNSKSEGKGISHSSRSGRRSHSENAGLSKSVTTGKSDSDTEGSSRTRTLGVNYSKTTGRSLALTSERIDKRAERLQKHLSETLIERFLRGRSKGMFRTAIYVSAEERATYERLARGVLSIYQGNQSSVTPLHLTDLKSLSATEEDQPIASIADLLRLRQMRGTGKLELPGAYAHSVPVLGDDTLQGATWLNTSELAFLAGFPSKELPGFKLRKSVDFAVNTAPLEEGDSGVKLGKVIQHGRELENKSVELPLRELNKHVFVSGVTGAGKTTTCMTLLLKSGLPFLVIEPAKTEYRALHGKGHDIEYYTLSREDLTPFRLNPFELLRGQKNLAGHIATLNATLAAVFPMEAAMPHIVEEAIINAYKARGWDIHSTENFIADDPWASDSNAWPTFSDMIGELDAVIRSKGMGREFEEKYRGSLMARLTNLTLGTKGRMLNTRHSLDFTRLLDKKVVIELEEIKNEEDKALFMGLILYRLAECMKQRHRQTPGFQHLTLVEEAHRLLSRPEPGDPGARKMGVEMFANLLAEVRKYGEGLIIADQIPNKLVSDVIKNTNTKIVHRLFAADDRNTVGDSIGLSDEQKDFLPLLQPGETIIYCGGWHAPVRLQIEEETRTSDAEISEQEIRKRGQQQLWEQRHTLLPHLAAHPAMRTPGILADFLYDGGRMLNMLLKLNYTRNHSDGLMGKNREKLVEKLIGSITRWAGRLELSENSETGCLLACILVDCAARKNFQYDDVEGAITEAVCRLNESLTSFDRYAIGDVFFNDSAFLADEESI